MPQQVKLHHATLWIIDPEEKWRRIIADSLRNRLPRHGIQPVFTEFDSARKARKRLGKKLPDIVICEANPEEELEEPGKIFTILWKERRLPPRGFLVSKADSPEIQLLVRTKDAAFVEKRHITTHPVLFTERVMTRIARP